MMVSRITSPSFSSFLALMVSGIEFCERKLDRISLKSSKFLSERNNLAAFTTSLAIGAFVSILISVLRTSPQVGWKFMISCVGFILYMHLLLWNLLLNRDEYPRSKRFRNLCGLGKNFIQTFVLGFIILLGDVCYFLVLGFVLIFLHLVLLSKFFYMLEDFGLLDGFFILFFGTATHLYRSPLGQFLVMLGAYLVLLALHLRYSRRGREEKGPKGEKSQRGGREDNKAREREAEAIKEEEMAREREAEAVGELEKLLRG